MPRAHPVNRLLAVAGELRAVAAELDESEAETRVAPVHWAHEIERAVDELKETAATNLLASPSSPALPPRGER